MADVAPLLLEIQMDLGKLNASVSTIMSSMDKVSAKATETGGHFTKLKDLMLGVFGGNLLTSGMMGLEKTFEEMNLAVQDAQVETGRLQTAMKNAGVGTKANTAIVEENIKSYSELGFTHAQAAQAMGTLITATGSVSESTKMMSMAADLARYKHEDLNTAATVLARGTQGSVKAFKELGITLDTTLPKNQAIAKAFDQLNEKIGGQATEYTKTFAGQIAVLKEKFNEVAVTIGNVVFPIVTKIIAVFMDAMKVIGDVYKVAIEPLVNFVKANSTVFVTFFGILAAGFAAFKTYEIVTKAVKTAQEAWYIATLLMNGVELAQIGITEGLTGAVAALDTAMSILTAPITLVVLGIAALAAGFIFAWNHSETFRTFMIRMAKDAITAISDLIQWFGDLATALIKIESGPLKLLLKGLSFLHVPGAKEALKGIENATDSVGKFFDDAAKKVRGYTDSLDSLANKKISLPNFLGGGSSGVAGSTGGDAGITGDVLGGGDTKGAAGAAKKAAAQYQKDLAEVTKIYGQMKTVIADYNKQVEALQDTRDKSIAAATKSHNDEIANLNRSAQDANFKSIRSYNEAVDAENLKHAEAYAAAQQSYDNAAADELQRKQDAYADALKTHNEAVANANRTYNESLASTDATFQEAKTNALEAYNQKVLDLQKANADKVAQLQQTSADKQLSIVQKSKDLLINAFESVTSVDAGKSLFMGGGTASGLVTNLKKQLDDAKKLQDDAAKLAGAGYSQTFIQEIIKNGPLIGDSMAQSVLNATPETAKQIQDLYGQVQSVSTDGMNALADQMNQGGQLATSALTQEYAQVGIDLQQSLADQASALNDSLTTEQATYQTALDSAVDAQQKSIADANKTLTDALANANSAYADAQASADRTYNEAMAKSLKTLKDAQANADQTLTDGLANSLQSLKDAKDDTALTLKEGLADSQKTFNEAVKSAQDSYDAAITDLNTNTLAKLKTLQDQLKATAALIASLGKSTNGIVSNAPVLIPALPGGSATPSNPGIPNAGSASGQTSGGVVNVNTNITTTNMTDPQAAANYVTQAIKLGIPQVIAV